MEDPLSIISLKNPYHLLATGFGSGLSPIMPGTMGTIVAIPFFLLLAKLPFYAYILIVGVAFFLGCILCQVTADDMQIHDHSSIVWDEFVGLWLTLSIVPLFKIDVTNWQVLVLGFVLFRFFDIIKPFPINFFDQKVHGGFGIMLDDVIAAIMALISLYFIISYMKYI